MDPLRQHDTQDDWVHATASKPADQPPPQPAFYPPHSYYAPPLSSPFGPDVSAGYFKEERLPDMMPSEPGTPQPSHRASISQDPYPAMRKPRAHRSDGMYPSEIGPKFLATKCLEPIYNVDHSTVLTPTIQGKMDRFFFTDNDWTCYRRNYFQVSCGFTLPGITFQQVQHMQGGAAPHHASSSMAPGMPEMAGMANAAYYDHATGNQRAFYPPPPYPAPPPHQEPQCFVRIDGQDVQVHQFCLSISAKVANSDKKIDLVQHTPKRDKGPQSTPMPRAVLPSNSNLNLNLASGSMGLSGGLQTIVTFERIQFKTATANNGKRRAAQQYYVCQIDLYVDVLVDGMPRQIKVATSQSDQLVVRGRSPGHYSDHQNNQQQNAANAANRFNPYNAHPYLAAMPPPHGPDPTAIAAYNPHVQSYPQASPSLLQQQQQQPQHHHHHPQQQHPHHQQHHHHPAAGAPPPPMMLNMGPPPPMRSLTFDYPSSPQQHQHPPSASTPQSPHPAQHAYGLPPNMATTPTTPTSATHHQNSHNKGPAASTTPAPPSSTTDQHTTSSISPSTPGLPTSYPGTPNSTSSNYASSYFHSQTHPSSTPLPNNLK